MAVAEADGGDAGDEVQVLALVDVPDAGAFAADEGDGQALAHRQEVLLFELDPVLFVQSCPDGTVPVSLSLDGAEQGVLRAAVHDDALATGFTGGCRQSVHLGYHTAFDHARLDAPRRVHRR